MSAPLPRSVSVVGGFLVFALSGLALHGCAAPATSDPGDDGTGAALPGRGDGTSSPAAAANAAPAGPCAGVAPATSLSTAKDVRDIHVVGDAVYFVSGNDVLRVAKAGGAATKVFTSPNLIHAFVDRTVLVAIEAPPLAPTATIEVVKATNAADTTQLTPEFPTPGDATAPANVKAATNYDAGGVDIFGSDAASFYLLTNERANDAIVKVDKAAPGTRTNVVAIPNAITHPQLAGAQIWFVRDQTAVLDVALPEAGKPAATPAVVFSLSDGSACTLAVGDAAYCSVGSSVQRRDLSGSNLTTVVDATSAKTSARLGGVVARSSAVYVASAAPDAQAKNFILALGSGSGSPAPTYVACGRGTVTAVDGDATSVAWTEADGGLFVAPR
jgi:hypothetical protein